MAVGLQGAAHTTQTVAVAAGGEQFEMVPSWEGTLVLALVVDTLLHGENVLSEVFRQ